MPIKPIELGRREQVQAALREQFRDAVPPKVANEEAVTLLYSTRLYTFRGIEYSVAPISYPDGLRLQALRVRAGFLKDKPETEETLAELLAIMEELVGWCWKLCRPLSWIRRALYPVLSNPFGNATEGELRDLLHFFWYCRMNSSVRLFQLIPTDEQFRLMPQMTSRSSLSDSLLGLVETDGR